MNGKIGFGIVVALIAIVGVWLTVTGKLLTWWNSVYNTDGTTDTGANMKEASSGSWGSSQTPASSTTPTQANAPASGPSAIASVTNGQFNATVGNISISSPLTLPTFNLSSLTGPIGGDGFAIAPINLGTWGASTGTTS